MSKWASVIAVLCLSCGGSSDSGLNGPGHTGGTGGSSTGGSNTGGSSTGGSSTGGSNTGGSSTGGSNTGGSNTGGGNTGGVAGGGTGGTSTGGTGGAAGGGTGGASTGGTGGTATGGTGGTSTGGTGGTSTGGTGGTSTGGTGGTATGGTGGTSTGGTGGTSTGGTGGTGGCAAGCGLFTCCNQTCVNTANDVNNCGGCGTKCTGAHPYCNNGVCGSPPCAGVGCPSNQSCCGTQCCSNGELCCEVQQSVTTLGCFAPVDGTCPKGCPGCVCDSADTLIATPSGEKMIADLREGDLVYSIDQGRLRAVPIRLTQRQQAPHHVVVELRLETGSVLHVSQRHPTSDGRLFGEIHAGDSVDGVRVTSVKLVPYAFDATYDILPSSDTGTYYANGVLISSTIAGAPRAFSFSSSGSAPASQR